MITREEYLKAKEIVDQYERDEYEDGMRQAEEDLDDDFDTDEAAERKEMELAERAWNCTCGAWQFNKDKTKVLHVADCCCGAE